MKGTAEEGMCGRLDFSIYGTRDTPINWSDECIQRLIKTGLKVGKATPCVFFFDEEGLRAYIHGDDFMVLELLKELKRMQTRSKISMS